jgi:hypothetical protein
VLLPGRDGSLYVIDDTDVYALNPDLQMLWRMGIGTSADARITLSPDGQFVYATGRLPRGQATMPALLAINAQTGISSAEVAFPAAIKVFHHPVVVKHPDGADFIYVTANSQNDGVFKTLKNVLEGELGRRMAKLDEVRTEAGLFSQPVTSSTVPKSDLKAKRLYVVRGTVGKDTTNARLVAVNAQSGAIENRDAPLIKDPSGNDASFVEPSWLWNGGNLVTDSLGNVLFWENGRLFAFGPNGKQLSAVNLSLPDKARLFFGPDGTLYAADTGAVQALVPHYGVKTAGAINVSSPTHLWVDGAVDKDAFLSAGGSVFLGTGFTVKPGAQLRILTNVPQPQPQ